MGRLTLDRRNGIKTGYWSPAKKEELVQRLGAYEDLGLEPEEIKKSVYKWIPVSERLPKDDTLKLVSRRFKAGACMIQQASCLRGTWYIDGSTRPMSGVEAWMELPVPYERGICK